MRFIYVLLALTVALSSLVGAPAIGAEKSPYAAGRFGVELDGNDAGLVRSVEGGQATSEKVKKRPAPAAQSKSAVLPREAIRPRPAVGTVQPLCPTPPCK